MVIKAADPLKLKPIILHLIKGTFVLPPSEKVCLKSFKVTMRIAVMLSFLVAL